MNVRRRGRTLPVITAVGDHRGRLASARAAFADPNLARLLLTWGVWVTTDWAFLITVSLKALELGGPAAVGLIGAVRVLPSALLSGAVAGLNDRLPRQFLLAFVHGSWTILALIMAWFALVEAPLLALLVAIGVGSAISSLLKPCQHALLPQLVRSPSQLIRANSAYATIEAAGTVLGPLLSAVLAGVGPPVVFGVLAGLYAVAAVAAVLIKTPFPLARCRAAGEAVHRRRTREAFEGVRLLLGKGTRTVWVLFLCQTTMRGFLNVIVILLAASAAVDTRPDTLFAAVGIGGLLGSVAGLGVGGGLKPARGFAVGIALWGLPVMIIGIWPEPAVAWAALAVLGLGNAMEDIFGYSLFNRLFPDHVAGRAWGVFYSSHAATVALGSVGAPLLVDAVGLNVAMVITGGIVGLAPLVLWRSLSAVDATMSRRNRSVAVTVEV